MRPWGFCIYCCLCNVILLYGYCHTLPYFLKILVLVQCPTLQYDCCHYSWGFHYLPREFLNLPRLLTTLKSFPVHGHISVFDIHSDWSFFVIQYSSTRILGQHHKYVQFIISRMLNPTILLPISAYSIGILYHFLFPSVLISSLSYAPSFKNSAMVYY